MRLRTLGVVCATCAVTAPSSAVAADPIAAAPAPLAPPLAAAPAPASALPVGAVAALAPPFAATSARRPSKAKAQLVERNVWLKQRHERLLGERLTRSERRDRREILHQLSAQRLLVKNLRLGRKIRSLRERLTGAAPDIPIPGHLATIAQCESGGNPRAVSSSGMYRGKYQFSFATWQAVGGTGDPAQASETEQDRRAAMLYRRAGPGQWPVCGR